MSRIRHRRPGAADPPQTDWFDWAKLVTFTVVLVLSIPIAGIQFFEQFAAGGQARTDALLAFAVFACVIVLVVLSYMKLWDDRPKRPRTPPASRPDEEGRRYRPS